MRYSHQVTDLPEARAQTTQHDRHEVQCACGRRHVADAPPQAGAPGTVTYGLNLQAWCVFLMVMHHVPVERCADIIASMAGTRPSDGWVHELLDRAASAVAAANMAIRAWVANISQVGDVLIQAGLITAGERDTFLRLAQDPSFVGNHPLLITAWGKKPGPPG